MPVVSMAYSNCKLFYSLHKIKREINIRLIIYQMI